MAAILGLNALAYFYIGEKIHLHELRAQAQTVVANVEAFGAWVANSGRVFGKPSYGIVPRECAYMKGRRSKDRDAKLEGSGMICR